MTTDGAARRDSLDDKGNRLFAGKVVRKDLVRKVKVGANVPVFVLEFLLGKYCASSDEVAIQMGLQVVNDTLANNYIRPDESMKAQAIVKGRGRHTFIDKVKVRLVDSDYWAEVTNFGHKNVHVPEHYVREYERLVMGGIWAQVDMRFEYDEESRGKNPFWIDKLTPIQIATFDLEEYRRIRGDFTTNEWVDLIIRSMGYEPGEMSRRLKLLFLVRLIPLGERNYNLVELGPRGTGKSYVVQEVSPYSALLTGGTTVANLFGHMSGRQKGMVQIWDVVGFDEVADLQKMPKEVITTMKTYCESGTFQRGQEAVSGDASFAMFGNTNQPVDVMVQTGHLFAPMPDIIRDDMAFIDRISASKRHHQRYAIPNDPPGGVRKAAEHRGARGPCIATWACGSGWRTWTPALMAKTGLAIKHKLPTMFVPQEHVEAGGLLSYSPDPADLYRRAG